MLLLLASFTLTTLIMLYAYMKLSVYLKLKSLPPSGRYHWLFGVVPEMVKGNPFEFHKREADKHGKMHTEIMPWGDHVVFINDFDIAKDLINSKVVQEKSQLYTKFKIKDSQGEYKKSMFSSNTKDPYWNYHRKGIAKFFTPRNLNIKAEYMIQYTQDIMRTMEEEGDFNMDEAMIQVTIRVIGKSGFDFDFDRIDGGIAHLSKILQEWVSEWVMGVMIPFRKQMLWNAKVRKYHQRNKELMNILQLVLDEYRENHPNWKEEEGNTELLGYLLRCKNPETGEYNDDETNKVEMLTHLIAGHDTTGHSLAWVFYFISQHDKVEADLFREIHDILGDNKIPTVQQATEASTPFLDACIAEGMRLKPVAAGGVGRVAMEDITVGGYDLPKGTKLNFNFYNMHNNKDTFKDVESFNPYRFKDPKVLADSYKNRTLLPFSAGKRDCVGKRFAMLEMKIVIMILIRNCKFDLVKEPTNKHDLTLHAKDGIFMRFGRQDEEGEEEIASSC